MRNRALLFGLLGLAGLSQALTIYPIPLEVKDRVGYLVIEDNENRTFKVSSEPFEEGMPDNLIVYPPQVRTKNGKALIKVAFKNTDRTVEQAGRVVITELKPSSDGISIAYSFSVPVFLKPAREIVNIKVDCQNERMIVKNEGTVHLKITKMDNKEVLIYILPQREKVLEKAQIIQTNRGEIKACE